MSSASVALMRASRRLLFNGRKHRAEMLLIASIASGIGTIITTIRATKATEPILKQHNNTREEIAEIVKNEPERFGPREESHMVTRLYLKTGARLAAAWAPVAACAVTSGVTAFFSWKIPHDETKRLARELRQARATIRKMSMGSGAIAAVENAENTDTKAPEDARSGPIPVMPWDHWWGDGDERWAEPLIHGARINANTLRAAENYWNHMLRIHGVVFMNDIYRYFGWKTTREGGQAGWVYNPSILGKQISFGIDNLKDQAMQWFLSGDDNSTRGVWLHFNADSYILDNALPKDEELAEYKKHLKKLGVKFECA